MKTRLLSILILMILASGCAGQAIAPAMPTAISVVGQASPTNAPAMTETVSPTAQVTQTLAATVAPNTSAGVTYNLLKDQSEVSYKVREQLANISLPNDAIGKTNQVTGKVVLKADGTIDSTASIFVVQAASIQSDHSQRDNYMRRNILQTDTYPTVTFVPKELKGLPEPLPSSGLVEFQVTGDLTIRDVTKSVTWDVTGTIQGDQATGVATTSFPFAEFNLPQPSVPIVLSIVDKITLQAKLILQRSAP